jgi:tetratricopeptide (TPR) repeat protein
MEREAGRHANAQRLANLHARVASPETGQLLLAQVAETWAKAQLDLALGTKNREAAKRQQEVAANHYKEAGSAYEAAAESVADPKQQADRLWRAVDCFSKAEDYEHEIEVLRKFIKLQPSDEQLSEAWYRLGEAHQGLGNSATIIKDCYEKCYSLMKPPFCYRAYYQMAAIEYHVNQNYAKAAQILQHNLNLMQVHTDREAHALSLYMLAGVYHRTEDYQQAARLWEPALRLYPAHPFALTARYHYAACCRQLADMEHRGMYRGGLVSKVDLQPNHRQQYTWWMEKAAASYQKLVDDLEVRRKTAPLQGYDAIIYRDSLFFLAEIRFEMGQYADAERLFKEIADRFATELDGLRARKRLFDSYIQLLTQPPPNTDYIVFKDACERYLTEAAQTLKQARALLEELSDTAFQAPMPNETRKDWERWLATAEQRLEETRNLVGGQAEPNTKTAGKVEESKPGP